MQRRLAMTTAISKRPAWWTRATEIAAAIRDRVPFTLLGLLVGGLAALALWTGYREVDLVLLGAGLIAAITLALSLVTVIAAAIRITMYLRRIGGGSALAIECGFPAQTGFRLPRLWWLPGVRVSWGWEHPRSQVRVRARGMWLDEELLAQRRAWSETIRRRIEIVDAFGLAGLVLRHTEERAVRMLPSVGGLRNMHVVRSLAGGSDITHPRGSPEGDRLDLRQYAPGDPIRFVLWSVFARTRELVVRTPERALSAARKTLAYLVTGAADEPAAGAARVALDVGALGGDWAFGADGVDEPASTKDAAFEALARSAHCPEERAGQGLAAFIRRAAADGSNGRAVVFVPAKPGPWLEGLLRASKDIPRDAAGRPPLEFVVCTDGISPDRPRGAGLSALAMMKDEPDADAVARAELQKVLGALGAMRAKVMVVDRRDGHVHASLN